MYLESEKEHEENIKANVTLSRYYYLGPKKLKSYFYELYDLGNCQPFAAVIFDMFYKCREHFLYDYDNLRSYNYEVIDDNTFTVHLQVSE